jgi:hypothetical protein
MNRPLKKTLNIILIVSLLLIILIINGFFSSYNYITAKQDIKLGHFNKVLINKNELRCRIQKEVGLKYGFTIENIQNVNRTKPINYLGIKAYNRVMKKAFIKQKGEVIYNKYINELDSINLQIVER